MNLGPDVDDVVRVQFQLYLLQGFFEWVGDFSTIAKVTENTVQRHGGLSAALHRPVDGFPNQLRDLCVSGSSNHKRGPRHEGEL